MFHGIGHGFYTYGNSCYHEGTPWENYWLNVEYDFKKDQLYVYDKNWGKVVSTLTLAENEEGSKSKRIIRRCVSTYIKAKSSFSVCC